MHLRIREICPLPITLKAGSHGDILRDIRSAYMSRHTADICISRCNVTSERMRHTRYIHLDIHPTYGLQFRLAGDFARHTPRHMCCLQHY